MSLSASATKPLPLSETLRDLALLRASDVDLAACLPLDGPTSPADGAGYPIDQSVARSYEFVKEARAAIKLLNRGEVDTQGGRVEDLRSRLEDVLKGLENATG